MSQLFPKKFFHILAVENIPGVKSLLMNSLTAAVMKAQLPTGSLVGH